MFNQVVRLHVPTITSCWQRHLCSYGTKIWCSALLHWMPRFCILNMFRFVWTFTYIAYNSLVSCPMSETVPSHKKRMCSDCLGELITHRGLLNPEQFCPDWDDQRRQIQIVERRNFNSRWCPLVGLGAISAIWIMTLNPWLIIDKQLTMPLVLYPRVGIASRSQQYEITIWKCCFHSDAVWWLGGWWLQKSPNRAVALCPTSCAKHRLRWSSVEELRVNELGPKKNTGIKSHPRKSLLQKYRATGRQHIQQSKGVILKPLHLPPGSRVWGQWWIPKCNKNNLRKRVAPQIIRATQANLKLELLPLCPIWSLWFGPNMWCLGEYHGLQPYR